MALICTTIAAAVLAPSAMAHVTISSASPARDGRVTKSPKTASIRFSGPIRRGTIKVYRLSTGVKVSKGTGGRDPRNIKRLLTSISAKLKTGRYRVVWTITAGDGHKESGRYIFKVSL